MIPELPGREDLGFHAAERTHQDRLQSIPHRLDRRSDGERRGQMPARPTARDEDRPPPRAARAHSVSSRSRSWRRADAFGGRPRERPILMRMPVASSEMIWLDRP